MKAIGLSLADSIKKAVQAKPIKKDSVVERVEVTIKSLRVAINCTNAFTPSDRKTLGLKVQALPSNAVANSVYTAYKKQLVGPALASENKLFMDSMIYSANQLADILELINKDINQLIAENAITIYNTKLSHLVIFSILGQAQMFADFMMYFIDAIGHDIGQESIPIAKYRVAFMSNNVSAAASVATQLAGKRGSYMFLATITEMKKTNSDILIVDENDQPTSQFVQNIPEFAKSAIASGKGRAVFHWLGQKWMLFKHSYYMRREKDKEWMEARVALLKLQMDGMDPNSEEYQKLKAIVDSYNEQIAKADAAIAAYYEG